MPEETTQKRTFTVDEKEYAVRDARAKTPKPQNPMSA